MGARDRVPRNECANTYAGSQRSREPDTTYDDVAASVTKELLVSERVQEGDHLGYRQPAKAVD